MTFVPPHQLLTEEENKLLKINLTQLTDKVNKCVQRTNFYNTKEMLKEVGFSVPPSMAKLDVVLGWPAKAVDGLASRLRLRGFVTPGQRDPNEDLDEIWTANGMVREWMQLQTSTFIHGCGFIAATPGDKAAGEPEVMVQSMPATEATGIWDVRRRRLSSALWAPGVDGMSTNRAVLFTPLNTVQMWQDENQVWEVKRTRNPLPHVPVTLAAYHPQLGRPFGMSRISRSVMYLTQMAARTLLRTEVGAEFYNAPQRYVMGADMEQFTGDDGQALVNAWETILGKVWLLGRDEEGDVPQVGQFSQQTMEPNVSMMRMITTLFAGETSLPVGSLGVIHDNPASAAAIDAAWADMTQLAELCQVDLGQAAVEVAQNALMIKNGKTELDKELRRLRPKWRGAAFSSDAAMADAVTKEIGAGVLLPDSTIALEKLGYDEAEIEMIKAEHEAKRKEEERKMAALGGAVPGEAGDTGAAPGEPQDREQPPAQVEPGVGRPGRPPAS